jgi:hypothetical protein
MIIASGIPEDEVDDWLERVRQNIQDTSIHSYMDV